MRNFLIVAMAVLFVMGVAQVACAVNGSDSETANSGIPEVAQVAITAASTTMNIGAPGSAGGAFIVPSDNGAKIEYTSVVNATQTRKITAKLGVGENAPAGTQLQAKVTGTPGTGEGTYQGTYSPLSNASSTDLITGIATCTTGIGGAAPATLDYRLQILTPTDMRADGDNAVTVTLTINDAVQLVPSDKSVVTDGPAVVSVGANYPKGQGAKLREPKSRGCGTGQSVAEKGDKWRLSPFFFLSTDADGWRSDADG